MASVKPEEGTIKNSERKDRSIRLWGGCQSCDPVRPVPFFTLLLLLSRGTSFGHFSRELETQSNVESGWQSADSWRWRRATCAS